MKSIILILAISASINAVAATNNGLSEIDSASAIMLNTAKFLVNEEAVNPEVFISSGYVKSATEMIASDIQITDGQTEEVKPLRLETPCHNPVCENNRIIENDIPAVAPLDFDYINKRKVALLKGPRL